MTQSNSISQDRFVHANSIDAVIQTYEECGEENWDGYGSLAVSPAVFFEAIRFICALPAKTAFTRNRAGTETCDGSIS